MARSTRLLPTTLLTWSFAAAVVIGSIGLVGCGASPFTSLGPQEPLLPALEGQAKFSDRFQLEEIPQFFFDLFGKELLEGNEVHHYQEQRLFDERGNLVEGWSGQLDSNRFVLQLDRQILAEDTFRGRHAEVAIGDHLRIKSETLFPSSYIIRKTEFDGHRFDFSFSHERHLFSILNSRISNTVYIPQNAGGGTLAPTGGKRTSTAAGDLGPAAFLANARLLGFRAQGLIGDIFRVGVTFLNLKQEFHQRTDNPFFGSVGNTPPEVLIMTFRDDSPEDGRMGAAFTQMEVVIRYQERLYDIETITFDPQTGEPLEEPLILRRPRPTQEQVLRWVVTAADMSDGSVILGAADGGQLGDPDSDPSVTREMPGRVPRVDGIDNYPLFSGSDGKLWRVANGFDAFHYYLDLRNLPAAAGMDLLNPHVVKSVEFRNIQVAGDYNIVVNGYSSGNVLPGDDSIPYLGMTANGLILLPYRDVYQAPGNVGQEDYDPGNVAMLSDPAQWKPTTIDSIQYGAARAATLVGVDLEGTVGNVLVRAQYSVNNKYAAYPTVSENITDFSLLPLDSGIIDPANSGFQADTLSEGRTFSANDGEQFKLTPGGSKHSSAEVAWFVQLKHRLGRILFEESFYHIDPGYTTNYRGWGSNINRDEAYNIRRTPGLAQEISNPFDQNIYWLVEDDDDNDDWPDSIDFDGVLPQADDRDQNGILDYLEDFLLFDADPPVFDDLVDLNNNGIIDSLEDDYEPEYEFEIDRKGYHLSAQWDIFDNMTLQFGWLNETEVSSARRNNTKYLQFDFQRDIAELGTFRLQNRLRLVQDDIPDYAITLRVGELEPVAVADKLDFFNARENTTTIQLLYNAIPNLILEVKYLLVLGRQSEPDEERAIVLDDPETPNVDERIDLMVPIRQVRQTRGMRQYPFYPDPVLLYDVTNWEARRYGVREFIDEDGNLNIREGKTIRRQLAIFKGRYEIPFTQLPGVGDFVSKIGEDLVLTPLYKYVVENAADRDKDELPVFSYSPFEGPTRMALDPLRIRPRDAESLEYLRFNMNNREIAQGVRLDYQFTQRVKVLMGFQYRKVINKDQDYKNYLIALGEDGFQQAPDLYRPDMRTRTFVIQMIQQGLWAGFNVVVLTEYRIRKDLIRNVKSNTTAIRAMVGF